MDNLIEERECRVCFSAENQEDLINPCKCSGTSKWIHKECLSQWRSLTTNPQAYTHCMECHTEYRFSNELIEIKLCEDTCLCLVKNIFPFILLNELCIFVISCAAILIGKGNGKMDMFDSHAQYSEYAPYFMVGSGIYCAIILLVFGFHFYFVKNKKLYLKYYAEMGNKRIGFAVAFVIISYMLDIFLGMMVFSWTIALFIRYHYLALDKVNRANNQIILPYNEIEII